jgi:hypothetical protein
MHMTMKIDAATRTVNEGEKRERLKLSAQLTKWLPMRRAQLALQGGESNDVAHADELAALLAGRFEPPATVDEVIDHLGLVGKVATAEQVGAWSQRERERASAWALAEHVAASDNDSERLSMPKCVKDLPTLQVQPTEQPTAPAVG